MKVLVQFADGFEEIEALTIVDVLRRAGIDTQMVSVTGKLQVMGAHAIPVIADVLFEDADYDSCDMIVLPGGQPGTNHLAKHSGLAKKIQQFADEGKWLAAICAAPSVFGQMGLLHGKHAVCYPGYEEKLLGAKLGTQAVSVDGTFLTSKGPGTAIAFSLTLVEALLDRATAEQLRRAMIAD